MGEAAIQIPEAKRFDVELSKIGLKLEFVANALENQDHPAGEILSSIAKELDTVVDEVVEFMAKQ